MIYHGTDKQREVFLPTLPQYRRPDIFAIFVTLFSNQNLKKKNI